MSNGVDDRGVTGHTTAALEVRTSPATRPRAARPRRRLRAVSTPLRSSSHSLHSDGAPLLDPGEGGIAVELLDCAVACAQR